jgi:hypothetical protein
MWAVSRCRRSRNVPPGSTPSAALWTSFREVEWLLMTDDQAVEQLEDARLVQDAHDAWVWRR